MTSPIKIDFVSDVVCPWCIIGLKGLEEALRRLGDDVEADVHFQPYELNPEMLPRASGWPIMQRRNMGRRAPNC